MLNFFNTVTFLTSWDILPEVAVPDLLIENSARGAGPDRGYPGVGPRASLTGHELAAVAGVSRSVSVPGRGLLTFPDQVVWIADTF